MGPLFWRVFLVNGAVLGLATATLAFSPATVSSPPLPTEVVVLGIGLVAMLAINAVLLRLGLAPLDRLVSVMGTIDLLRPGQRIPDAGNSDLTPLTRAFNDMLSRLESERAISSAQTLSAQEDERRRVARELHDQVGQSLTVVLLELKRAVTDAPPPLREHLLQVQETARASLDDVRGIARRLRPDLLEDLGMLAALAALANDFSDLTGIPVRRRFTNQPSDLPKEVELVVYRVAQECLTNVARHAQADRVELALTLDDGVLVLSVRDDGCGMTQPEGAGIRGMRERALLVDGQLTIDAGDDGGTEVGLRVRPNPGQQASSHP